MAEQKTKPTAISVESFIDRIDNESVRDDCRVLIKMMQKVTGSPPVMWGSSIVGFCKRSACSIKVPWIDTTTVSFCVNLRRLFRRRLVHVSLRSFLCLGISVICGATMISCDKEDPTVTLFELDVKESYPTALTDNW